VTAAERIADLEAQLVAAQKERDHWRDMACALVRQLPAPPLPPQPLPHQPYLLPPVLPWAPPVITW